MCNYSEYLRQEAKEEQKIKDKLEVLERMDAHHLNDIDIMFILDVDAEQLKALRLKLHEKSQAVVNVD